MIENIKVYFFNNRDDAVIFYKNDKGEYKTISGSVEAGFKILKKIANSNNYSDLEELKEKGYYDIINSADLENELDKFKNSSVTVNVDEECDDDISEFNLTDKINNFKDKIGSKIKSNKKLMQLDFMKVKKLLVVSGLLLGSGIVVTGISKLGKVKRNNIPNYNSEVNTEVSNYYNENTECDTYSSLDELLKNSNINNSKRSALTSIWNQLSYYNETIAENHACNDGTRLAHSWDEIMVDYLIYNNISGSEANQIFDDYNLDTAVLANAYKSASDQDILCYSVLTEPTYKENMINSETGKDFYRKYETLVIKYNTCGDDITIKTSIVNEFYQNVYTDFFNGTKLSTNESYKLSVIPIIKAFTNLTKDISSTNKLSTEELSYIDTLGSRENVLIYLSNITDSVQIKDLGDEFTYTQIMQEALMELCDKGIYNIDIQSRNISNSIEYKSRFVLKEQNNITDDTESNPYANSTKNNSSNVNITTNNSTAGEIPNEEDSIIPSWMLENNNQDSDDISNTNNNADKSNTTNENNTEYVDPSVNEDVPNIEQDTPSIRGNKLKQNYYYNAINSIIDEMSNDNDYIAKLLVKMK